MKYVIIYWTRFGNNKKIVDYLAGKLKGEVQVFKTEEANPASMPKADYYIFSAAAEKFTLQKDMRIFMKNLQNMDGKKYGIINTHGRKKKNWLPAMEKILGKKGMVKVSETDFIISGAPQEGPGLENGWEAKLDLFCTKLK